MQEPEKIESDITRPFKLTSRSIKIITEAASCGVISRKGIVAILPARLAKNSEKLDRALAWLIGFLRTLGVFTVTSETREIVRRAKLASAKRRRERIPGGISDEKIISLLFRDLHHTILSSEEEKLWGELARTLNDTEARNQLIVHNFKYVVNIAKEFCRFRSHDLTFADLISAGFTGLIRTAQIFDERKGRFSNYARYWIVQAIYRAIENEGKLVRIPVHVWVDYWTLRRRRKELAQKFGRNPTNREIAVHTHFSREKVRDVFHTMEIVVHSLNTLPKRGGSFEANQYLGDKLPDTRTLTPLQYAEAKEELEKAKEQFQVFRETIATYLSPREQAIFEMRHGLGGVKSPKTLEEIGNAMGLTRQRICQILERIQEKLHNSGVGEPDMALVQERIGSLQELVG